MNYIIKQQSKTCNLYISNTKTHVSYVLILIDKNKSLNFTFYCHRKRYICLLLIFIVYFNSINCLCEAWKQTIKMKYNSKDQFLNLYFFFQ